MELRTLCNAALRQANPNLACAPLDGPQGSTRQVEPTARLPNHLAYGTVWRIENGFPDARTSTIRKLANVIGVEPKELVRREAN